MLFLHFTNQVSQNILCVVAYSICLPGDVDWTVLCDDVDFIELTVLGGQSRLEHKKVLFLYFFSS